MAGNTRLTELKELYNGLTRGEKQSLVIYAKSYEDALIPIFRHAGTFIEALENDPEITAAGLTKALKLDPKDKMALNTLILRVQDLIVQAAVLDQNLHRPGMYRNRFRIQAANDKKLTQAKIFLDRGMIKPVEKMLLDVQTKADKYELPDQSAASLTLQRLIALEWRSLRTFNRLDAELAEARKNAAWHVQAEDLYLNFRLEQKRDSFDRNKLSVYGHELQLLLEVYPSDTAKYYAERVQVALDRLDHDFASAANRVQALLDMVEDSPALKSKRITSDLYYDLGYIQMQRRNLAAAADAFAKGEKLVKNETYENYRFKRDLLLLDLYRDNLDTAKDTIETRINSTYTRQKSFASTQYHFLRAVAAYFGKNNRGAVRQLAEEIKVMEKPDSRDALGHHVLLLMAASELQQPASTAPAKDVKETKDAALESLEHLKQIRGAADLTARESTIIDMMLKLGEHDFNFKKAYKSIKRFLVRLRKQKNDLIWQPFTFEIMPVQYWYEAQLDGRRTGMKLPPSPGTEEETPDLTKMAAEAIPQVRRKRGRPKGSKNVKGRKVKKTKTAAAKAKKTTASAAKTKSAAKAKTAKATPAKAKATGTPVKTGTAAKATKAAPKKRMAKAAKPAKTAAKTAAKTTAKTTAKTVRKTAATKASTPKETTATKATKTTRASKTTKATPKAKKTATAKPKATTKEKEAKATKATKATKTTKKATSTAKKTAKAKTTTKKSASTAKAKGSSTKKSAASKKD